MFFKIRHLTCPFFHNIPVKSNNIYQQIFPARAPSSEIKINEIRKSYSGISPGFNRTAYQQAGYQLLALAVTLGISIVSGLITGIFNLYVVCHNFSVVEYHN